MSQRVILDIDDETAEQIAAVPVIDRFVQSLDVRYRRPRSKLFGGMEEGRLDLKALLLKLHSAVRVQLKPTDRAQPGQVALRYLVEDHPEAGRLRFYGRNLTEMSREELMAIIAAQREGKL